MLHYRLAGLGPKPMLSKPALKYPSILLPYPFYLHPLLLSSTTSPPFSYPLTHIPMGGEVPPLQEGVL